MNRAVRGPLTAGVAGVHLVENLAEIARLKEPDCAAVICQRTDQAAILDWIGDLPAARLPKVRTALAVANAGEVLEQIVVDAGMPDCSQRDAFVEDVVVLAKAFAALMGCEHLRLRLDPVSTNACRRFHVDAMHARLVCTYRGAATQYGTALDGDDPQVIAAAKTGDPMVMRGTLWPESPSADLRHRSPPIEGSGETRLLLVLDPVFDLEKELAREP
ncbi:MAG: DUF1826 domain-containing protein [Pseudomonadota bacterium]